VSSFGRERVGGFGLATQEKPLFFAFGSSTYPAAALTWLTIRKLTNTDKNLPLSIATLRLRVLPH
jgi:hypothetical protein